MPNRSWNMQNDHVVLDTNSLLASISRRGSAYPVWKGFQEGRYTLCVSNEILEEYEEVIVVDCAFAANATYIVSNDTHYDVLKEIQFPELLVLKLRTFIERLTANMP